MSIFGVNVGVRGKSGGSRLEAMAMVDTGATDTVLPPSVLRRVGVEVEVGRRFTLPMAAMWSWGLVRRVYP